MDLEKGLRKRIVDWEKAKVSGDEKRIQLTRGAVRGYAAAFLTVIHPEDPFDKDEVARLEQQYGMPGPFQGERASRYAPSHEWLPSYLQREAHGSAPVKTRKRRA